MTIERLDLTFPGEGSSILLLARDDNGVVVGTIKVKPKVFVAEFYFLFVVESMRRQGVGRRLIEAVEEIARLMGCTAISCYVKPSNKGARMFYHELGFIHAWTFDDEDIILVRQIEPRSISQLLGGAS